MTLGISDDHIALHETATWVTIMSPAVPRALLDGAPDTCHRLDYLAALGWLGCTFRRVGGSVYGWASWVCRSRISTAWLPRSADVLVRRHRRRGAGERAPPCCPVLADDPARRCRVSTHCSGGVADCGSCRRRRWTCRGAPADDRPVATSHDRRVADVRATRRRSGSAGRPRRCRRLACLAGGPVPGGALCVETARTPQVRGSSSPIGQFQCVTHRCGRLSFLEQAGRLRGRARPAESNYERGSTAAVAGASSRASQGCKDCVRLGASVHRARLHCTARAPLRRCWADRRVRAATVDLARKAGLRRSLAVDLPHEAEPIAAEAAFLADLNARHDEGGDHRGRRYLRDCLSPGRDASHRAIVTSSSARRVRRPHLARGFSLPTLIDRHAQHKGWMGRRFAASERCQMSASPAPGATSLSCRQASRADDGWFSRGRRSGPLWRCWGKGRGSVRPHDPTLAENKRLTSSRRHAQRGSGHPPLR